MALPSIHSPTADLHSHQRAIVQVKGILENLGLAGAKDGATAVANLLNGKALKLATLALAQSVGTPARGQVGAGDADWIVVGSGGGAPGFNVNWSQMAGGNPTQFRKLPSGLVIVYFAVQTTNANDASAAFNFLAGYRPGANGTYGLSWTGNSGGVGAVNLVAATGGFAPNAGAAIATKTFQGSLLFYAEQ